MMHSMHTETPHDLRNVDLNLLVALDSLCHERSVTKAAERLGITQSAMSHALSRLRSLFDDQLIVRSGRTMALTPRAQSLVLRLRSNLNDLGRIIEDKPEFHARTEQRIFRLIAPDIVELRLLAPLLSRLRNIAPGIRLEMLPIPSHPSDALETGAADVAILPALVGSDAPFGPRGDTRLMQTTLLRDSLRAYVRAAHPLASLKRVSLKRYLSYEHLLVSPTGSGPGLIDAVLHEQGENRTVGLRVSSFATALEGLKHSDLILTAPTELGRIENSGSGLHSFSIPLSLPEHAVNLTWHPRFNEEPGHRWFRDQVAGVMKAGHSRSK